MMMTKLVLTVSVALATLTLAGLLGAASATGAAAAACKSGPTTSGGARAYRYCGPASAVVKVGGRTLRYSGGSCRRTAVALELNIGTAIVDAKAPRTFPRHFGVMVGRVFGVGKPAPRDGTYSGGTLVFADHGKRFASLSTKLVLAGKRTRGTFAGRVLGGPSVSGTFRCS
jgi:hypothetical protein